jgi:hypothetical protein
MASGAQGGGNLVEMLLGILMGEKVGEIVGVQPNAPRHPVAGQLRNEMKDKLSRKAVPDCWKAPGVVPAPFHMDLT